MHDGKLYLSLNDAIALALENNLDIAIARYNLNIADTDVLRARAGATILGVPLGIVQNTPGGGVGGVGAQVGSGSGGTTLGAGGAGAGTSGLTGSTLGLGPIINSFDPVLTGTFQEDHFSQQATSIFSGCPPGHEFGAEHRNCELLLPAGFPMGHEPGCRLQQYPSHHEQLLFESESCLELRIQGDGDSASSAGFWVCFQHAFYPNRQEQP
jgi:hypothetical protein